MGMYTELIIKCRIKRDAPAKVLEILEYMFGPSEQYDPVDLPDHPFFKCERWMAIGDCHSHYHIPAVLNYYKDTRLFSRSDLKNYGDEIGQFLDWLNPYIVGDPGGCIGWVWYEEWDEPELIYKG